MWLGLIKKNLKKYKTQFVPVDSEHFSIWFALDNIDNNLVDKIYLAASGGPFLNKPINKLKKAISSKQQIIQIGKWVKKFL